LAATCWLKDTTEIVIAFWRFYFDASKAAPNKFRDDLGFPELSASAASFPFMVDLLRNEKPVYFVLYDFRPVRLFGSISISPEPIGEGEK
jgi:hypothetical protein